MNSTCNRLYSQIEIIILSKLPPTTVKRWLEYFSDCVPSIRKGDLDYYQFETVEVLKRISELRNEKYRLKSIRHQLEQEGFNRKKEASEENGSGGKITQEKDISTKMEKEVDSQAILLTLHALAAEMHSISKKLEVLCKR
ncbi:MerR family transcriptional regulator [Paenibacillus mesotrionivorans]|uniref:MerR family transcriptional regulator n=1 Tax=Paenibacillus mesotrionivorans TaxID=3160968 RepID=A0ACC7P1Y6_9BACL